MVQTLLNRSKKILETEHKSILSAAFVIAASYLASALLGLVRNHLLAARFFGGMEADLDVYFAAFVLPDTIFQLLVVGAVSAAFIPIFQDHLARSKAEAAHLANAALTTISLILFALTTILIIFARPIAGVLAHYSPEKLDLMANLIRIMALAQILFTLSAFLTGILQAQRRFLIPAIAPLLYNLGTIIGIYFFSSRFGIYAAAFGVVLGAFLHVLVQLPLVAHLGFTPRPVINPRYPGVLTMLRLMPPRALALGLDQIERWVAVNLTSLLAAGSLSIFNFARQLYALPVSLFGVSLSQASFPALADEAAHSDLTKFKQTLAKSLSQIFFFALPASILVLILRIPLVRLAFGARTFPWEATLLTGKSLAFLALSIAPLAVTQVLVRAFHALKDTRRPLYVGAFTMIIFTLSATYASRSAGYGVLGITAAMSLSNYLDFIFLYLLLRRRIGSLAITWRLTKMIIASGATAFALWLPMRLLDQFVFDTTRTLPLIVLTLIVSLVGFLVYLIFCKILRIEELADVAALVKKLGNWRRILGESDEVIEPPVSAS
ncbi:MAG: murein biosynthesis integral membrane protein MurJ [Patescibacteria group bacterium]